jgi:ubiquinone/menaquinone biosynthesis C-methylase UbiE
MFDKDIETKRYDDVADSFLKDNNINKNVEIPKYLYAPYEFYFASLKIENEKSKLLEIGAGTGNNTGPLIKMFYKVCATDISLKSVRLLKKKFKGNTNFVAKYADMEKLPFSNDSFDVVCGTGVLSYGENTIVMSEIYRVLKPGGKLFLVDSLNENPIYKFNRYLHYLRGLRSKSTLLRMPTIKTINEYKRKFAKVDVKYFGAVTWILPILNRVLNKNLTYNFSNWIDRIFKIKKSGFKFVMRAEKKQ